MKNKKSAAVGLVICFVAVIAMVGAVTFSRYNRREAGIKLAQSKEPTDTSNTKEKMDDTRTTNSSTVQKVEQQEQEKPKEEEMQSTAPTSARPSALAFSEDTLLAWPVDGNVMMNYSMDKTIYFATLDQYKYNPTDYFGGNRR